MTEAGKASSEQKRRRWGETCWTRLLISAGVIRWENSRSMTMFWPHCLALLSLSAFFSLSSDLFSILSFLKLFLDSISFDLSSSVTLASVSSHSLRLRSPSFFFCSFASAFFSAFFASYFCCFSSFFWAFFDRGSCCGAAGEVDSSFWESSMAFLSFCGASIVCSETSSARFRAGFEWCRVSRVSSICRCPGTCKRTIDDAKVVKETTSSPLPLLPEM